MSHADFAMPPRKARRSADERHAAHHPDDISPGTIAPLPVKHRPGWFAGLASTASQWAGRPLTFIAAVATVILWAATGPIFGYSDTWQLVINTGTTIVTFLMVFLIQNSQNRDTLSLQIKLAELIVAMRGAHDQMATIEDMSDDDLQALHDEYRARCDSARAVLAQRHTSQQTTELGPAYLPEHDQNFAIRRTHECVSDTSYNIELPARRRYHILRY